EARAGVLHGGEVAVEAAGSTVAAGAGGDLAPGRYRGLSVRDNGRGMAPETLARAMEPFFTTKGRERGSGLGLSMVYGFALQSGGGLRIDSSLGAGTEVRLYLPVGQGGAARAPAGGLGRGGP